MISKRSSKTIQNILSIRNNVISSRNTSTRTSLASSTSASSSASASLTTKRALSSTYQHYEKQHQNTRAMFRNGGNVASTATDSRVAPLIHSSFYQQQQEKRQIMQKMKFHTESDYHRKADDTLETIQDTLEYYFEDFADDMEKNFSTNGLEINYASGVLTITIPPHGTWVLNKQTPNRQIWWSSPLTGPRRYEWDEEGERWVWTKFVDYCNSVKAKNANAGKEVDGGEGNVSWTETVSLGEALKKEMIDLFQSEDGLEELDEL